MSRTTSLGCDTAPGPTPGWAAVTERLQDQGYTVTALANPLRGVPSDAAYLTSVLATISGPIVLVGHSYGGMVITNAATGNPNVKASARRGTLSWHQRRNGGESADRHHRKE